MLNFSTGENLEIKKNQQKNFTLRSEMKVLENYLDLIQMQVVSLKNPYKMIKVMNGMRIKKQRNN